MTTKINASVRMAAIRVMAATEADAGELVMWAQKALGVKGKARERLPVESVEFSQGTGNCTLFLAVDLDHERKVPKLRVRIQCQFGTWKDHQVVEGNNAKAVLKKAKAAAAELATEAEYHAPAKAKGTKEVLVLLNSLS